ncbi:MAG TPA: decaprenyl-phosphate phosphoribosyltransferase [Phycisphaerae bacterium]|nr:decaprenyl-phosphate phosphoribosyltransferase [Phycisphaerae bacterium]HRR84319.1 decaprenyl-phosphate phosphoribosyltransferase [Phycisphaerae bacterium]
MVNYIRLLRPADWIKNVFVFAALLFGKQLENRQAVMLSLLAFVTFCLASSAGYVLNDILDRKRDRLHPTKKDRPLACGTVSVASASAMVAVLVALCVILCWLTLPPAFWLTVGIYLALSWTYSVALKHRMLLDVIVIAMLFVLRAIGGAEAISVEVSPWLLTCTFMLCLFLGFGKRRCEVAMIDNSHAMRGHRPLLVRYTPDLLTHLLSTSAGVTIITFLLYTLDTTRKSPFEATKQNLIYTLPLVVYGVYRYAMLIELGKGTGPTDLILKDAPFLAAVLLWVLSAWAILYGFPQLGITLPSLTTAPAG